MLFKEFKGVMQGHVSTMLESSSALFVSDVDKDVMWELYLNSFPPGKNEIFRERREHDCSCCKHFIKNFGNVVAINGKGMISIWDFELNDDEYGPVVKKMAEFVKSSSISDVFVTKEHGFGTDKNHEKLEDGTILTWEHFRVDLP